MPRCPVCDAAVDLAAAEHPPFCGERCRLNDLGAWASESYRIPARGAAPGEDGAGAAEGDEPR